MPNPLSRDPNRPSRPMRKPLSTKIFEAWHDFTMGMDETAKNILVLILAIMMVASIFFCGLMTNTITATIVQGPHPVHVYPTVTMNFDK